MKPLFVAALLLAVFPATHQAFDRKPVSQAEAEKIADEYLAKMTLEEKVTIIHGDAIYHNAGVARLKIPDFLPSDGPCAVRPELNNNGAYIFTGKTTDCAIALPTLSAVAATWNPAMARLFGETLSSELRARGKDMSLGPSINIMRTPINGRTFEYMGEDPFLTAHLCVPVIQGVQSNDVSACIKHFALNNQELDRGSVNVNVDERALREIYLPGFEAAIKEGQVWGLMGAYNRYGGEWCCENSWLLDTLLRKEWSYKGAVISDWGAVHDPRKAVLAGCDMDSGTNHRYNGLANLVKAGTIPESVINQRARNMLILLAKIRKLGPESATRAKGEIDTPAHRAAARKIAEESIVLLKNNAGVLPLNPAKIKTVLVFGANATAKHCVDPSISGGCNLALAGGSGEGKPFYEITPLEGLKKRLGDQVKIDYIPATSNEFTPIPSGCLNTVDPVTTVKGWEAVYFNNRNLEGQPAVKRYEGDIKFDWKGGAPLPGINAQNFSARYTAKVVAPETGEYLFRLGNDDGARFMVDGKPVITSWRIAGVDPTTGKIRLNAGKEYTFCVEYFQAAETSALFLDWQLPSNPANLSGNALVQRAKAADAVIVFTGNTHALEQEGSDRHSMQLPPGQDSMAQSLLAANPKTIIVNQSGAPVEMPWADQAQTIVQYWFSGQEGGNALAAILCGDANPSGKLPCTFPKKLEDTPAHSMHNYTAGSVNYAEGLLVGYRWFDAKNIAPLFPFGHGLSYSTFSYGKPRLDKPMMFKNGFLTVSVPITNTGKLAGAETAQLYLHEAAPKVTRPDQELKGFARVELAPGQTKLAQFKLTPRDLSYWSVEEKGWKADPGLFEIRVGSSSRDIRQKAQFTLR